MGNGKNVGTQLWWTACSAVHLIQGPESSNTLVTAATEMGMSFLTVGGPQGLHKVYPFWPRIENFYGYKWIVRSTLQNAVRGKVGEPTRDRLASYIISREGSYNTSDRFLCSLFLFFFFSRMRKFQKRKGRKNDPMVCPLNGRLRVILHMRHGCLLKVCVLVQLKVITHTTLKLLF